MSKPARKGAATSRPTKKKTAGGERLRCIVWVYADGEKGEDMEDVIVLDMDARLPARLRELSRKMSEKVESTRYRINRLFEGGCRAQVVSSAVLAAKSGYELVRNGQWRLEDFVENAYCWDVFFLDEAEFDWVWDLTDVVAENNDVVVESGAKAEGRFCGGFDVGVDSFRIPLDKLETRKN